MAASGAGASAHSTAPLVAAGGASTATYTDVPTFADRRGSAPFLSLLVVLGGVLAIFSVLVSVVPDNAFVTVAPEADHVVNTTATLIAGAVAVLAWIRYRETGQLDSILQASAFLVLFAGGTVSLLLLVTGQDARFGFDRADPGQAPLYIWTALRLIAAPLLVVGAFSALRPTTWRRARRRTSAALGILVPTVLALVIIAVVMRLGDSLPALVPMPQLEAVTEPAPVSAASVVSPPMLYTQLAIGALFLVAALCYGVAFGRSRGGRPYDAYLAVALVLAAFSQFHFGIVPGAYSDVLTISDGFRMGFYAITGLGIAAAASRDLVELREANATLHRLRAADQQRIALEERARLAREVHDGLVQDLWLARLTHGRLLEALRKATGISRDARDTADRVDAILEDALAEARQAVVSLQPQDDPSFGALLVRFVEDYGDRFGLEVECVIRGEPIALAGEQQAEVLRICREALNNVRKHADATLVTVTFENRQPVLRLTVADNGKGFDADKAQRGFGLPGMMARALDIGARLTVDSEPLGGTRVVLELTPQAPGTAGAP